MSSGTSGTSGSSSSSKPSTLNAAVDMAVTVGHIDAYISIIIAGIIAFVACMFGVYYISNNKVWLGVLCIIGAFLLMLLAYLYFYFVTTNRAFAAVAGVGAVANMVGGGRPGLLPDLIRQKVMHKDKI